MIISLFTPGMSWSFCLISMLAIESKGLSKSMRLTWIVAFSTLRAVAMWYTSITNIKRKNPTMLSNAIFTFLLIFIMGEFWFEWIYEKGKKVVLRNGFFISL